MPRPRLLSDAAVAEVSRLLADPKARRTHRKGPWGDRPSLRDIARHLEGKGLLPRSPDTGRARTVSAIARTLGYLYPHERRGDEPLGTPGERRRGRAA
jgi:hypothetical protein